MPTNRDTELKRILVSGASGLLGLNFCNIFYKKFSVYGLVNRTRLDHLPFHVVQTDLLRADLNDLLDEVRPDVVLHCAALANIDQCEKDPETAEKINAEIPGKFAAAAGKRGIRFIHISTDAVFDGEERKTGGYREDDETNPISRYAATKLAGERNVLSANPEALVARVNFYGWSTSGRRSLVEFFYNNLRAGNPVNGFNDVFFSTLYVRELADILCEMIGLDAKGIYHVFSSDFRSKYDFGRSIAEKFGFDPDLVRPISWKDGGLTAKRSPNLIMNTDKLRSLLGHDLPTQEMCLERFYQDTSEGLRERIQGFVDAEKSEG